MESIIEEDETQLRDHFPRSLPKDNVEEDEGRSNVAHQLRGTNKIKKSGSNGSTSLNSNTFQ